MWKQAGKASGKTFDVADMTWETESWLTHYRQDFPGGASDKEPACHFRRLKRRRFSFPGLGKYAGGGYGNLLQYSCLENPMDRGAWQATVHNVAKSWTDSVTNTQ